MLKLIRNLSNIIAAKKHGVSNPNYLSSFYSNRASKKQEDAIKKRVQYFIDNELPDRKLELELKNLKDEIKSQGDKVRNLKKTNASKDEIDKALIKLFKNRSIFQKKIEHLINDKSSTETKSDTFKLENLLKERFFYDQAFKLYGGASGLYDLGPLGCSIQNNLVDEWRKHFVVFDKMHQIECSILTPEAVLKASGHVAKFSDIMVKDSRTQESFRVDHLIKSFVENALSDDEKKPRNLNSLKELLKKIENSEITSASDIDDAIAQYGIQSPTTGNPLSNSSRFNLMFHTQLGANEANKCFMRPETAQGIFLNFKKLYEFNQKHLPFAVAQIGKSFRNEINPKSGLIRQREFLMAEIEHFLDPLTKYESIEKFALVQDLELSLLSEKEQENSTEPVKIKLRSALDNKIINSQTLAYYLGRIYLFAKKIGIKEEKIRFRQHMRNEMAHYANECWDLECETSHGWIECAGIADRGDFDLRQHATFTGKKTVETFLPHVIEPSFGIGRLMYTVLEHSFKKRKNDQDRLYLSLPYSIAPYKCSILPLKESDEKFQPIIQSISNCLTENQIVHRVDDTSGAIGKRYWRADECGIPFALTLDYKTLDDFSVTLRERDSMEQLRIKIADVESIFNELSKEKISWNELKSIYE